MSRFSLVVDAIGPARAVKLMSLYPPYLGAGVRVDDVDPQLRSVSVSMRLTRWNKNAVGTHFGGSLYSLCDPWFMLLLMARLGPDFIVWDKRAVIEFRSPGRGRVKAHFVVDDAWLAELRAEVERSGRAEPVLHAEVTNDDGGVVCRVEKVISVRKKPPR